MTSSSGCDVSGGGVQVTSSSGCDVSGGGVQVTSSSGCDETCRDVRNHTTVLTGAINDIKAFLCCFE